MISEISMLFPTGLLFLCAFATKSGNTVGKASGHTNNLLSSIIYCSYSILLIYDQQFRKMMAIMRIPGDGLGSNLLI